MRLKGRTRVSLCSTRATGYERSPTETKRRTRNASRCIRYDHATRTNVAIRPRFRAWRGPRRGPLTSRRSATALTGANQRRRSAPDALPGTRLKNGCCPSPPVPVQRQSRRPVMMPAGRIPGAARERNVSSRPREPHSPHRRKHPRGDVLLSEMIRKNCTRKGDYMQARSRVTGDHVGGAIHTFLTRKSRTKNALNSFTRERRQNGAATI